MGSQAELILRGFGYVHCHQLWCIFTVQISNFKIYVYIEENFMRILEM